MSASLIRCILCKGHWLPVDILVCDRCRNASADPEAVDRIFSDLQQYRLFMAYRFSDTKKFLNRMRAAATAAGFEDVHGDTVVRIVGQFSNFQGTPVDAYRMVADNLQGLGFGMYTNVRSVSVSLTDRGKSWTMVEVRAMLHDEVTGIGGVMR